MGESRRFDSLPIRTRLTDEEVARFTVQRYRFPGVDVRARLIRQYPNGEVASHVVGYIGRINQREKERIEDWPEEDQANYRGTDHIGKLGAEQSYERELHGLTGFERVETSAGGQAVRLLANTPATPGNTVKLTIDLKLQKLVEDMFGERRGALVAIDPRNGEVLAFVSKPTFDPNLFVEGIDEESWKVLNESLDKPLLNRAMRGTYPPGSTYKPFMALGALELGKRIAQHHHQRPRLLHVWRAPLWQPRKRTRRRHGHAPRHRRIEQRLLLHPGQRNGRGRHPRLHGPTRLRTDHRHRFARRTERHFAQPGLEAGELQKARTTALVRGRNHLAGHRPGLQQLHHAASWRRPWPHWPTAAPNTQPHLALATEDAITHTGEARTAKEVTPMGFKPNNVNLILHAMHGVTTNGTATRVFAGAGYLSGGKTGTAQAVSLGKRERYDARKMEEHQRDHSLYVAFAPLDKPTVALAVMVENAGFGSAHAAPIARRVFDYLLMDQYPNPIDFAAVQKGAAGAPIGTPLKASEVPWITPGDPPKTPAPAPSAQP